MTLRELANSGIEFKGCDELAIVEKGREDFPLGYVRSLDKVPDKFDDRRVTGIYPKSRRLFIEIEQKRFAAATIGILDK